MHSGIKVRLLSHGGNQNRLFYSRVELTARSSTVLAYTALKSPAFLWSLVGWYRGKYILYTFMDEIHLFDSFSAQCAMKYELAIIHLSIFHCNQNWTAANKAAAAGQALGSGIFFFFQQVFVCCCRSASWDQQGFYERKRPPSLIWSVWSWPY